MFFDFPMFYSVCRFSGQLKAAGPNSMVQVINFLS